jgi:hypothetical protein
MTTVSWVWRQFPATYMVVRSFKTLLSEEARSQEMKRKPLASPRTLRQFRASVTTRRKMASLRVSSQRRRLRRAQFCTSNSAIFIQLPTELDRAEPGCG